MKGFTLVETMVAITILTLAVSGAFMAASSAINAANIASDQLTASYLAQEGIEYVRVMRDNTYLTAYHAAGADISATAWSSFISSVGTLRLPDLLDPGIPTSFIRTIQVTRVTDFDEKIVSQVVWNFHGIQHSVIITDHLTPWQ